MWGAMGLRSSCGEQEAERFMAGKSRFFGRRVNVYDTYIQPVMCDYLLFLCARTRHDRFRITVLILVLEGLVIFVLVD